MSNIVGRSTQAPINVLYNDAIRTHKISILTKFKFSVSYSILANFLTEVLLDIF